MEIIGNAIIGTAREFEENKVELNGVALTQVTINALGAHKVIEYFGEGPKPARGKTPKVYKAESKDGMVFRLPESE
jgi:hypothetical protein